MFGHPEGRSPHLYVNRLKAEHRSRLKPSSYEFQFEGLSNFSLSVEGLVQIQDINPRIQKWNIKLILNLCMNYMVHVFSTLWRIKSQPFNSTSCSDNALRLLVLVVGRLHWGLQVMSSFSTWGCVLKGCFGRGIFWRPKLRLKGIEDFNLEHCSNTKYGGPRERKPAASPTMREDHSTSEWIWSIRRTHKILLAQIPTFSRPYPNWVLRLKNVMHPNDRWQEDCKMGLGGCRPRCFESNTIFHL